MDKLSRYYGILIFIVIVGLAGMYCVKSIVNTYHSVITANDNLKSKQSLLETKRRDKTVLENKIKQLKNVSANVQKKLYSPADADLGNETLFFTLYSDLIEMIHSNSIKIKSMKYEYNPQGDAFVESNTGAYFVSGIDMDLVANYTNLGKLIQDIYQYPYYIRINQLDVIPYEKDKKILLVNLKLNLYARTAPEEVQEEVTEE